MKVEQERVYVHSGWKDLKVMSSLWLSSHLAWGQLRTLPKKWSWIKSGWESAQGKGPNFPQEVICKFLQYLDKWMIKGSKFLTIDQDYHNFSGFYTTCLQEYVPAYQIMCVCSIAVVGNIDIHFSFKWTDHSFSCHLASATEKREDKLTPFFKFSSYLFG